MAISGIGNGLSGDMLTSKLENNYKFEAEQQRIRAATERDRLESLAEIRFQNVNREFLAEQDNARKLYSLKKENAKTLTDIEIAKAKTIDQFNEELLKSKYDAELSYANKLNDLKLAQIKGLSQAAIKANNALVDAQKRAIDAYEDAYAGFLKRTKIRAADLQKNINEKLGALGIPEDQNERTGSQNSQANRIQKRMEQADVEARRYKVENLLDADLGKSISNFVKKIGDIDTNFEAGFKTAFVSSINILSSLSQQLGATAEDIAKSKSAVDTRLQGQTGDTVMGSYWDKISQDLTGAAGISPYVQQKEIAAAIKNAVNSGIAFNVEQRAFLSVIKDKIATTFDAFDASLVRLIRIQEQDTTASRLGMESAMTSFLNNMYETTEYLQSISKNVRGSLLEASSLMSAQDAVNLEYNTQKQLGSLYSVGMSDSAVQNIAGNLGKIAAGQLEGVTSGNTSNLLIMAANNANMSIADMLKEGLDGSNTNKLMQAAVEYMSKLYTDAKDSKVLQQQFASVFGVTASDLKAAYNLVKDQATISAISGSDLNYAGGIAQLYNMAGTMWKRTSAGELLSNAWGNFQYTLASGLQSDPITYATYKIGTLLKDSVGGINIPALSVMGNSVDLETTVADLMLAGAMGSSIIKGIVNMGTTGGVGGITANALLNGFGISQAGISSVSRGGYTPLLVSGESVTETGSTVGNGSADDIYNKTTKDATDSANKDLDNLKEEEENEVTNKVINESIINIATILNGIIENGAMRTYSVNYNLTGQN